MSSQAARGSGNASRNNVQPKLVWVEVPADTKDPNYKRQIRSHVTRAQHRRTRDRARQALRDSIEARSDNIASHALTLERPLLSTPIEQNAIEEEHVAGTTRAVNIADLLNPQSNTQTWSAGNRAPVSKVPPDSEEELSRDPLIWMLHNAMVHPGSNLGQAFSNGAMAFRTFALDDSSNVVGSSLHHLDLDVSKVLSYYEFIVKMESLDFEQYYENDSAVVAGAAHGRLMRFITKDPVLVKIAILIKTRYLLASKGRPLSPTELYQVLDFRGHLINSLNAALSDPVRAMSDYMLVAVMMFAAHELLYVSGEAYHIHMQGLVHMVNMRGGMPRIGENDPYLERMLIWHDANIAKHAGCELYLQKVDEPSSLSGPLKPMEIYSASDPLPPAHDQVRLTEEV